MDESHPRGKMPREKGLPRLFDDDDLTRATFLGEKAPDGRLQERQAGLPAVPDEKRYVRARLALRDWRIDDSKRPLGERHAEEPGAQPGVDPCQSQVGRPTPLAVEASPYRIRNDTFSPVSELCPATTSGSPPVERPCQTRTVEEQRTQPTPQLIPPSARVLLLSRPVRWPGECPPAARISVKTGRSSESSNASLRRQTLHSARRRDRSRRVESRLLP